MEYDIEKILQTYEDDYNPDPRPMAQEPLTMNQGGRIGLLEGGLLTTGPNKGKYSFRNQVDGEYITRYYDTKKQFNDAIKESQAKPRGGSRGDYTKKISTPTTTELEVAENVYSKRYDKTGIKLWQSLTQSERGQIRQKKTTGNKRGPKEGLAVNVEGKPNFVVKREKALKRNAPFFQKGTKDFQFHHIMNIGGEIPLDTNDIAVISGEMNRALAPDNRKLNNLGDKISDLLNDQPKNYLKKIDQLNNEGESIVKKAIKKLPNEYKNLIGFNKVVPITDEYGTMINIDSQKIGGSKQKGIKLENLTTQQASELRKQIKTDATAGNITKFKSQVIPGLESLMKAADNIKGDFAKKKFLTAGFKTLGVAVGAPLIAYDTYQAYKKGKPMLEALEEGFIGTSVIGDTKKVFTLTPEEREARSVVKQDQMNKQVSQDFSMLDVDFTRPLVQSNLGVDQATKNYEIAKQRVLDLETQKNADRAKNRQFSGIRSLEIDL